MITAVIPTLNEEKFVAEAIRGVSFADEILVIDSFSSDRTVEVARDMGAIVIQRKFDDFSSQKNHAIQQAKNEWILVIDADERVSGALAAEIKRAAKNPGDRVAFFLFRNFYFQGNRVRYGGWQTDKAIRLFKKDKGRYNGNLVHETIEPEGPVGFLSQRLDHYSYRDHEQYTAKLEMYARLQAEELYQKNSRPWFLLIAVKPAFRFFVHYFVRLGLLDGRAGFELARAHAVGVRKRYIYLNAKYRETEESRVAMKPNYERGD